MCLTYAGFLVPPSTLCVSTRLFYTTYIQSGLLDVEIVVCILTRRVRIAASPVVGEKLGVRVLLRVLCRAHEKHVLEEMGETF